MRHDFSIEEHAAIHVGYRVRVMPLPRRIRALVGGATIADSTRVLVMHETRYPPVFYFPRADVDMALLARTELQTNCPFKGNASYWSIRTGPREIANAAWSYEDPFDESEVVKGYIAFDWDSIDQWFADDEELIERPGDAAPALPNPFVDWLVEEAWRPGSMPELLQQLAAILQRAGFPIWRVRLLIQTLNPQLFALAYTWQRDSDEISEYQATHAGLQTEQFQNSPFAAILRGEGGIRRRLEGDNPRIDFPVLQELKDEGVTDYVAVPLRFSDGQINILVLSSDVPGGFTTEQLGQLYEVLANLSRLLEAHAQRVSSLTLLQTYLGRDAGQRVIDGLIKRGDGEELNAVIWFSDLRDSTALAEALERETYLEALNQYFDSVAGAVIEQGGEVLKFIGDAVLAIFAIDDAPNSAALACDNALAAAKLARKRLDKINAERVSAGQPALAFGTALHVGKLTYGNIGTPRRLDFTVIGPSVNEAARLESMCKELGHAVIVSEAFAAQSSCKLSALGQYGLRGVSQPQQLFTLEDVAAT